MSEASANERAADASALGAVVLGLTQHRAFRRLERRMALLREHAP